MEKKSTLIEYWRCYTCVDRMSRDKQPIKNCGRCFANQSRDKFHDDIIKIIPQTKEMNPMAKAIVANKLWGDHL